MKASIFIMFLTLVFSLPAQRDKFNLPDNYYKMVIDKTTCSEVEDLFGKPNHSTSGKISASCIKTEYPVKKYYYDRLGMEIRFHRTKENRTYRISWIYLFGSSMLTLGESIKLGVSDYDTVIKELGTPTFKNDIGILMLQYDEVSNGRTYVLVFDPTSRKLNEIGITCKMPNGRLLW